MITRALRSSCLALLMASAACTGNTSSSESAPPASAQAPAPPHSRTPAPSHPAPSHPRIVFLGDSLTAGLGLDRDQNYPSLLQQRLVDRGYTFDVVNAGVSGDTTAGGLRRADWSLEGDVKVLVVALGANDGLRGLPIDEMKKNLAAIIERAKARHAVVILAGMEAPPNNGPEYAAEFRAVYPDLARRYDVPLIPFLLQGVAGLSDLNQGDGIHPNPKGARMVADVVWTTLEPIIQRVLEGDGFSRRQHPK